MIWIREYVPLKARGTKGSSLWAEDGLLAAQSVEQDADVGACCTFRWNEILE